MKGSIIQSTIMNWSKLEKKNPKILDIFFFNNLSVKLRKTYQGMALGNIEFQMVATFILMKENSILQ